MARLVCYALAVVLCAVASEAAIIRAIEPASGGINGQTRLTVSGSGFDMRGRSNDIFIGTGLEGAFCDPIPNECTDTRIVCLTDAFRGSGKLPLSVRSFGFLADCQVTGGCGFEYTLEATPEVTSIFPEWLTAGESRDTRLTVNGLRFSQGDPTVGNFDFTMHLGDEERCELLGQVASTAFTCNVQPMLPGTLPVDIVMGASGRATLSGPKSVVLYPTVTGVSPATGSIAGGTLVTMSGTSFSTELAENVVTVHGKPCTVTRVEADQLFCRTSASNPTATPARAWTEGRARLEMWYDLPGTELERHLIGKLQFHQPSETREVSSFGLGGVYCTNCAARITTWFVAPASGAFTVSATGDDQYELWLAGDETPIKRAQQQPENSSNVLDVTPFHTRRVAWGTYNNHQDPHTVVLVQGAKYWMRGWVKQGTGGMSFNAVVRDPNGAAVALSGANISLGSDWMPPVSVTVRDMPALFDEACYAWGTCAFNYAAAATPYITSVSGTATPGSIVTIGGRGFDTQAVKPATPAQCVASTLCGGGGCNCINNQQCQQHSDLCGWNTTSGRCDFLTTPPCDTWSFNRVTIGGAPCDVTSQTATELQCRLGYAAGAGSFPVSVQVGSRGLAAGSPLLTVTASIRAISPAAGSVNGGNSLTVLGYGFDGEDGVASVLVANVDCPITSIVSYKIVCRLPAGAAGNAAVKLVTKSRVAAVANFAYTYSTRLVRPGTTVQRGSATVKPRIASLSGGTTMSIYVPGVDIKPTSRTFVLFGGIPCDVTFALGQTVTCRSRGVNAARVAPGTVRVEHTDGVVETSTIPTIQFRRSVTNVDNSVASAVGATLVRIDIDGYPLRQSDISVAAFGQPCVEMTYSSSNRIYCLVGAKPTVPPTLPTLATLSFGGDGNVLTNPLNGMAYTASVRANIDGSVTIPAGANYLMSKRQFARPFVFKSQIMVSSDNPRGGRVNMRVCVTENGMDASGYRGIIADTNDGRFAIGTPTGKSRTSTRQFDGAFEAVGLDPTSFHDVRIEAHRRFIRFYIDDVLIRTVEDASAQVGSVGFGLNGQSIRVRSYVIEDLYPQSLQVNVSGQPIHSREDVIWGNGPTISSFAPRTVAPGVEITIGGTDFGRWPYEVFALPSEGAMIGPDTPRVCQGNLVWNSASRRHTFYCEAGAIPAGSYHFTMRTGTGQASFSMGGTYRAAVTSITPAFAGTGGKLITMMGGGFTGAGTLSATVGGNPCPIRQRSNDRIVCLAAAHGTGTAAATVTLDGSTVSVCRSCTLRYNLTAPSVTAISPTSGGHGTVVTFTGTGFETSGVTILAGEVGCSAWRRTETEIKCTMGRSSTTGSKQLVVHFAQAGAATIANGVTSTFTFQTAASGASPSSGSVHGGTRIAIRGSNFNLGAGTTNFASHTFTSAEAGWSNAPSALWTSCEAATSMFGPIYSAPIAKTFTSLPTHAAVRIVYEIVEVSANVVATVDGKRFEIPATKCELSTMCGSSWMSTCTASGSFIVPHTASSMTLTLNNERSSGMFGVVSYRVQTLASMQHTVSIGGSSCAVTLVEPSAIYCTTPSGTEGSASIAASAGGASVCTDCTFTYSTGSTPSVTTGSVSQLAGLPADTTMIPQAAEVNGVSVTYSDAGLSVRRVSSSGWNAGANSPQAIAAPTTGAQGITFTAADVCAGMYGLSSTKVHISASYTTIDFAIYLRSDGWVQIYERGSYMAQVATYRAGDVFSVYYDSSSSAVRYSKNGVIIYASGLTAQWPLYFASSVHNNGCGVDAVKYIAARSESTRIVFSGNGIADSSTATVTIGGVACIDSYVTNGHASCWTTAANAASTGALSVVVHAAGGTGATSSVTLVQGASAPSGTSGSAHGGHMLTILGNGFTAATTVNIGAACNVKSWTATSIVCETSAHAAGEQTVVVTTGATTHTCMGNMDVHASSAITTCAYTYDSNSPAITTVTGTVTSGAEITVSGTGFRAGSKVMLSGTYTCATTAFSDAAITCRLPVIPAGAHQLSVIAPNYGAASNAQTANPALAFTGISTTATGDQGGARIVMTGTNIGNDGMGAVSVTVGGNALCASIVRAGTTLTCVTNAGAFNGAVSVTINGATAQAAGAFVASAANAPTVTGVVPAAGGAGSTVTVQGTNLGAGVALIGGAECLIIESTATTAICTLQSGTAGGNQALTVRTNDRGTGSGSATFFVRTMIGSVSPFRGPVTGGGSVTIYGSGFTATVANLRVRLAGVTCAVTNASSNWIHCTAGATNNDNNRTDVVVAVVDAAVTTDTVSATAYSYNTALTATFTAINPAAGSAAGMESITFTGTGFSTDTTQNVVMIGGKRCPVSSVASDGSSLVCSTQAMDINPTAAIDIIVNEQGRATNTNSLTFSSTLNINSISGGSFSVEGGATVTFTGTGFWTFSASDWQHSYYKLSVGGLPCPIVSSTATEIRCRLPGSRRPHVPMATLVDRYPLKPEASGVTVALVANGVAATVASTVAVSYSHAETPRVTSVSPSGIVAPGAAVTFTGSGFGTGGNEAYIGTSPCTVTQQSSTQVVCTTSTSTFGPGFARVLVPSKGFSTTELSCPAGQYLMCNGKCVSNSSCQYVEWGMETCPQLTHLIIHDTFCHSNGGTDRVGIPFKTDDDTVFNLNCPMYSCEGGDCDTSLYIGGRGGVVSTCGPDPSGHLLEVRPSIASLSTDRSSIGGGKVVTITGNHFGTNASLVVVRANAATCIVTSVTNTEIVCETTPQVRSASQVQVYVQGTLATCSSCSFTYVDANIPFVNSTNPTYPRFNQALTITGTNFGTDQNAATVHIGSRICAITSLSNTQIVCTAPQMAAGSHSIRVTTPTLGSSAGAVVEYRLYVSGVSPNSGSLIGGATVTIAGTGFSADSRAWLGSCPTVFKSVTNGALLVETTNCSSGAQRVAVRNGATSSRCDGSCSDYSFSIDTTPLVSTVNVNGAAVTLGLSNLGSAAQADVTIMGGRAACAISAFSSSQISCNLAEHHPGRYPLVVTVAARGRARQAVETDPAPSVTFTASVASFAPTTGSRGGGQALTITGTGFTSAKQYLSASIGSTPCVITSSTATQIVCTTGQTDTAHVSTVTVTAVDSAMLDAATPVASTATFNYDDALTPVITSVTPNRGSTAGGTMLTIGGSSLTTALTVTIDGIACAQSAAQQSQTTASGGSLFFCTTGAHRTLLEASRVKAATGANGDAYTTQTFHYIDLWSRWTTWGNSPPPVEGDSAVISEGQSVMVDYNPPRFFLVIVMGHLLFDNDADIDFACTYIMINFGRFTVGTPEKPYLRKATITLHGDRLTPEIPVHGAKVIALRHGALDMHGEKRQPTWTKLASTAPVGAATITVRGPVDWRVGEFIVVAPTDYEFHNAEHRMITGVTPANGQAATVTLQLEYPLDHEHYGQRQCFGANNEVCVDEIAEVGLLTRNIVVKGDRNSMRLGFGGTMFLMPMGADSNKHARLSYVEFAQCGQMFIVGRYPVHYHVTGAVPNSYVNGTSVHESLNRAFSIHGVHNNTYVNNVAYNIMGHAFFIEDGSERFNVIENNMVSVVKSTTSNLNTDVTPANFWIVSPTNIIRGNAACGGHAYGFWISPFHPHSTGPTHSVNDCPATHKMTDFRDNTAHSNRKYGLNIFQFWWPKQVECDFNGPDAPAYIRNHVSYKNHIHGITMGNQEAGEVGSVIIENYTAADNGLVHPDASAYWIEKNRCENMTIGIQNSRLIALTNNQPARRRTARRAINLPEGDNFFSRNITFVNYDGENHGFEPQAWAERFSLCFPWGWEAVSSGLSWINSPNRIRMRFHHHGVLNDDDGTLTGTARTQIVAKSTIFDDTICQTVGPAAYLRECLVCPDSYKIRRFGISTVNEIWTWQKWMTAGREEEVPEITRQYLMTAPINHSIGIDFQWWRTPRVWDWRFGAFKFLQPGERAKFWTIYNETKHHVYGTFNNKPLNRTWYGAEPMLADNVSAYNFNNDTMKYAGLMVYPETAAMRVESFNCPDEGCPLPPLPPPSWDKVCTSYHSADSWASGTVPSYGASVMVPSSDALCLGEGNTNGTCAAGRVYEYNYFSLRIEGSFQLFDDHCPCDGAVIHVVVQSNIWIRNGGILVGNDTHPLTRCKFRLSLQAPPFNDVTQMGNYRLNPWGFRSISVESGMLQLIAPAPQPLWARLRVTAAAGASSITLDQPVQWALGAKIAIAGTTRNTMYTETVGINPDWEESEKRVIRAVSADRLTITLDAPLRYAHWGSAPQTIGNATYNVGAEVIILDRNICIDAGLPDDLSEPPFLAGWQLNVGCTPGNYEGCSGPGDNVGWPMGIGKPGYLKIDGVQFKDIGQSALQHGSIEIDGLNDQVDAAQSVFRNNVIDRAFNMAIWIRETTTNLNIVNNTFWNVSGDGIRATGSGNNIDGNVFVRVNGPDQICDKVYFKFWDCRQAGMRIHAGNRVHNNVIASSAGAGYLTDGDLCSSTGRWHNNYVHSARDGLLVADTPAEIFYNWAADNTVPENCRKVGGVTAYWIGDQGFMAWYTKGDLRVHDLTVVEATVGSAALLMYPPASVVGTYVPTATYTNIHMAGHWDGQSCRSPAHFWTCKKSLLDSKPWCSFFHLGHGQQRMGTTGIVETLFSSSEFGMRKTIGEHKHRWLEMDSFATVAGQAHHTDVVFKNFDGSDRCGLKNVAFHQNPYSNDTFHHHTFRRVTWDSGMRNGGEFWARRTYGDTHHPADAFTPTYYLDYDNFKYGAYWPDSPNHILVHDLDGTFTRTGSRTSIVASETITRETVFSRLRYHGRGFQNMPAARPGCTWQARWSAYTCDRRYNWTSIVIDNLAEDRLTRRPGPVVLCKGDGMIEPNGDPICQGGVVDYASGPVMKGKTARATLERMTRYWFHAENGGNYTLSFRGQPPVWMRLYVTDYEYLGVGNNVGVTLNLRYFGLNSANRVGVYVDGVRQRPSVGYGYPWEQTPPVSWPSPTDPAGTHYHDKFVDAQATTSSGSQGIQRNVLSFVVRAGAVIDLRQEPIVQVNANLAMPIDEFFNNKETFAAAMAQTLGIDESRMKFAEIVPGTTRRRQGGTGTRVAIDVEQDSRAASSNFNSAAAAGTESNDLAAIVSSVQNVAGRADPVPGYNVTTLTAEVVQVRIPRPPINVVYGTPYIGLNVSRGAETINSTVVRNLIHQWVLTTMGPALGAPYNTSLEDDVGVANVFFDRDTGRTRVVILMIYENSTDSKVGLEYLYDMFNTSQSRAVLPGYTVHDHLFELNGWTPEGTARSDDGDDLWATEGSVLKFAVGAAIGLIVVFAIGGALLYYFINVRPKKMDRKKKAAAGDEFEGTEPQHDADNQA